MIQIVKSHFQPENHEVLWIDLSVNPASLKIFRSDGWTLIGVDNEVVSSIIKLLEEQDNNISKLNKTIDTEVLKKKSISNKSTFTQVVVSSPLLCNNCPFVPPLGTCILLLSVCYNKA